MAPRFAPSDVEGLIRHIFSTQPNADAARTELSTRQVLTAPLRLQREIDGWFNQPVRASHFLEVGCGPGTPLAAALLCLIVAQRLIRRSDGVPMLAARGDALPLADQAVSATILLDVNGHVANPRVVLREVSRVTQADEDLPLATPNRYSLAAEPHISVWGVGWLPRAWQPAFVRWSSGKSYRYTRLLSTWESARLLKRHMAFRYRFVVPAVAEGEIGRVS